MAIAQHDEQRMQYKKPDYQYKDFELQKFAEELEPFRVHGEDKMGKYSFLDIKAYLKAVGAVARDGAAVVRGFRRVVPKGKRADEYVFDCVTPAHEIIMEKHDQLMQYFGRKEYGKRKGLEELEALRNGNA